MADHTLIEWTDATWNPITGCSVLSPGCTNCYAMKLAGTRMKHHESRAGLTVDTKAGPVWNGEVRLNEQWLTQPLQWKRPRRVFVCAHADLFHEAVPDAWIDRVFAVMALAPQHTFQVLTKRSKRMQEYMAANPGIRIRSAMQAIRRQAVIEMNWPLPNVWLGVSVEDQKRADERIPDLLATPAAVRWISAEPLLGPVDIGKWIPTCYECGVSCGERVAHYPKVERCFDCGEECDQDTEPAISEGCPKCGGELEPVCPACNGTMVYQHPDTPNIDWVVVGGESGHKARPMHPDWARSLRDQCAAAGVPFLFKQWGEWIDADEWTRAREKDGWFVVGHETGTPLSYSVAEAVGANVGFSVSHRSDGGSDFKVGKSRAGRLLNGIEHNGYPEVRS